MNNLITSIGLMSGTSSDGIDASIIKSDGENEVHFIGNYFLPYDEKIKLKIRSLKEKINLIIDLEKNKLEIDILEKEITFLHAKIVNLIIENNKIEKSKINLIGFHGHTIFHSFKEKKTKQIGNGRLLSQLTRLSVVNNFRENDIESGGQGAPLVPIFHKLLQVKLKLKTPLLFVNIGGISNLTFLGNNKEIVSLDTGPGNILIDKMIQFKSKNKFQFDENGAIAFTGSVDKNILDSYLSDPYYESLPPKSLDVNDFSLSPLRGLNLKDSVATLSELTSLTIVNALSFFNVKPNEIILCGGGRKNKYIFQRIKKLSNILTKSIDQYKINGDFIESKAFAYLAIRSLLKKPISFPETTGVIMQSTGGDFIEFK
ncbi:anhydro-N-acetylmuramic acid kinase [Pelagibacteraceae bacterium]|nr:anhydro-N-acetylmuramic acid kinase [Pelagibacteraceae bacterium]